MKKYAFAAALALGLGGVAQAAIIDLQPEQAAGGSPSAAASSAASSAHLPARSVPNLLPTQRVEIVAPPTNMSELPEPEVFAMMLLGLILIGYKAGRGSSEKFK